MNRINQNWSQADESQADENQVDENQVDDYSPELISALLFLSCSELPDFLEAGSLGLLSVQEVARLNGKRPFPCVNDSITRAY